MGVVTLCLLVCVRMAWTDGTARGTERPTATGDFIDEEMLIRELTEVVSSADGEYGVYVKVINSGETLGIRPEEEFFAGSCYKLPLILMLYEKAAAGEVDLGDKVAYSREDREAGTGVIIGYQYGTEFTLRELARLAVVKSDNVAGNMLLRYLGRARFVEYEKGAGARVVPETVNNSSPADLGMFAERLLRFCSTNDDLGPELMGHFTATEHRDRIPALLPTSARVANKIGTWPGFVNDVAIVTDGDINYVLAVMSKNVSSVETASRVIAEISLRVYGHVVGRAGASEANKRSSSGHHQSAG
jgi:beta-lactamase class A